MKSNLRQQPFHFHALKSYKIQLTCREDHLTNYKRNFSPVFDYVHSFHLRYKCKKRNKLIRVYTGYITSTGAMGHSGIIQEGNFNGTLSY